VHARVLVPPSRPDLNPLVVMLAQRGLEAVAFPRLGVAAPPTEATAEALARGPECDILLFAGGPSVSYWLAAGAQPGAALVAAVGYAAEQVLRRAGLAVACAPARHTAEAVAEELGAAAGGLEGRTVLLLRGEASGRELPEELARRGARCLDLLGYRLEVQAPAEEAERLFAARFDAVALANPSAVRVLARAARQLGRELSSLAPGALCAAAGPATASEARRHQLSPALVVEPRDGRSLLALADALADRLRAGFG